MNLYADFIRNGKNNHYAPTAFKLVVQRLKELTNEEIDINSSLVFYHDNQIYCYYDFLIFQLTGMPSIDCLGLVVSPSDIDLPADKLQELQENYLKFLLSNPDSNFHKKMIKLFEYIESK